MTIDNTMAWLQEKELFSSEKARTFAEKVLKCSPEIQTHFENWMQNDTLPQIEVEGYTLRKLIDEYDMKPIGAFLTLDWLMREPAVAKQALQEGYDTIIFPPQTGPAKEAPPPAANGESEKPS